MRLGGGSQVSLAASQSGYQGMAPMSTFGGPQLPFMPFVGGSMAGGSDYGGPTAGMGMMNPMMTGGMMGYQNTGSVYGMPMMGAPRNTVMSNFGMFGGGAGSGMGAGSMEGAPMGSGLGLGGGQRPMSTFSMATSVNPFAGPSTNANPTEDELFNALRNYLSTQDLMSVTKK